MFISWGTVGRSHLAHNIRGTKPFKLPATDGVPISNITNWIQRLTKKNWNTIARFLQDKTIICFTWAFSNKESRIAFGWNMASRTIHAHRMRFLVPQLRNACPESHITWNLDEVSAQFQHLFGVYPSLERQRIR